MTVLWLILAAAIAVSVVEWLDGADDEFPSDD